jgi:hypothetical protein
MEIKLIAIDKAKEAAIKMFMAASLNKKNHTL